MQASEIPWHIRLAVYDHFIEHGTAPAIDDLCQASGCDADVVRRSLHTLAASHQIVMAPASSEEIWMAHPFSGVPTEFLVTTTKRSYWANCAWDVLGIAAVVREECRTVMRCAESGETDEMHMRPGVQVTRHGVVHFLVPPRDFWKNIGFT